MPYQPNQSFQTSPLGGALASGMSTLADEFKRQADEDKRRARTFKSLVEFADAALGIPKEKSMVLDLDSLQGLVEGTVAKNRLAEAQQRMQLTQEQIGALRDERQNSARAPQFAGELARLLPQAPGEVDPNFSGDPETQVGRLTPAIFAQAAQSSGYRPDVRMFQQMLEQSRPEADAPVVFDDIGTRIPELKGVYTNRKTGASIDTRDKKSTPRLETYEVPGEFPGDPPQRRTRLVRDVSEEEAKQFEQGAAPTGSPAAAPASSAAKASKTVGPKLRLITGPADGTADATVQRAQAAIDDGKDPRAVLQRLTEGGYTVRLDYQ